MPAQIDDFINPRSMLTPGGATALVATLSGIIFAATGVHVHVLLAVLSLFFAAVVFFSKEFADPSMTKTAKGFFYIVNALIIFAMSTGTHATFDKRPDQTPLQEGRKLKGEVGGGFFISSAFAQPVTDQVTILRQERPIFFDWTKHEHGWNIPRPTKGSAVAVSTTDDSSTLRKVFANAGLMTPNIRVDLELDKSKLPAGAEVNAVQWILPSAYFPTSTNVTSSAKSNYGLSIKAWNSFAVKAKVELVGGETIDIVEFVDIKKALAAER